MILKKYKSKARQECLKELFHPNEHVQRLKKGYSDLKPTVSKAQKEENNRAMREISSKALFS